MQNQSIRSPFVNPMPRVMEALQAYAAGDTDAASAGFTLYTGIWHSAVDRNGEPLSQASRLAELEAAGYTVQWILNSEGSWNLQLQMPKGFGRPPLSLGTSAPLSLRTHLDKAQGKPSNDWTKDLVENHPKVYEKLHDQLLAHEQALEAAAAKEAEVTAQAAN